MKTDCSIIPDKLPSNADISGIGVFVGYVGSAAIVIAIVTFFYILSFDPSENPFAPSHEGAPASVFQPNPFDLVVLGYRRKLGSWLQMPKSPTRDRSATSDITSTTGACSQASQVTTKAQPQMKRWHVALTKCVLAMSDLQIFTGISVLTSGFIQLQYSITSWHWQQLVYLAWFSNVTHQACLTFLRSYLYKYPLERTWRLTCMGIISIMLVAALVPTANYDWGFYRAQPLSEYTNAHFGTRPYPADFAACYFSMLSSADGFSVASVVLSMVFIIVGYIVRIVRLHENLSVRLIGNMRKKISSVIQRWLAIMWRRTGAATSRNGLAVLLLYRPMLAVFMVLRGLSDLWTSMLFEVLWLVASFVWGIIQLRDIRNMFSEYHAEWTFGQVVPVVLLIAPIVGILQVFYSDNDRVTSNVAQDLTPGRRQNTLEESQSTLLHTSGDSVEILDDLSTKSSPWYRFSIHFTMIVCVSNLFAILLLYLIYGIQDIIYAVVPINTIRFSDIGYGILGWLPLNIPLYLIVFNLMGFLIEAALHSDQNGNTRLNKVANRLKLVLCFIVLAPSMFNIFCFEDIGNRYSSLGLLGVYAIYVLLAIIYRLFGGAGLIANLTDMFGWIGRLACCFQTYS